jgi:hypothetical protein
MQRAIPDVRGLALVHRRRATGDDLAGGSDAEEIRFELDGCEARALWQVGDMPAAQSQSASMMITGAQTMLLPATTS